MKSIYSREFGAPILFPARHETIRPGGESRWPPIEQLGTRPASRPSNSIWRPFANYSITWPRAAFRTSIRPLRYVVEDKKQPRD